MNAGRLLSNIRDPIKIGKGIRQEEYWSTFSYFYALLFFGEEMPLTTAITIDTTDITRIKAVTVLLVPFGCIVMMYRYADRNLGHGQDRFYIWLGRGAISLSTSGLLN